MKFCSNCGKAIASIQTKQNDNVTTDTTNPESEKTLLEFSTYMFGLEGKSKGFVNVPTENYKLTNERLLIVSQGVVTKKRDEIELYKVKDIVVKQGIKDKMLNVGDIQIISTDESTPKLNLRRIKDPINVKETIRNAVKAARKAAGVTIRQEI